MPKFYASEIKRTFDTQTGEPSWECWLSNKPPQVRYSDFATMHQYHAARNLWKQACEAITCEITIHIVSASREEVEREVAVFMQAS